MRSNLKIGLWIVLGVAGITAILLAVLFHAWRPKFATIQGAIIRSDQDTRKQLPLANVLVIATRGRTEASARSDASGYFKITFPDAIWPEQTVDMHFQRDGYQSLDLHLRMIFRSTVRRLVIAAMEPIPEKVTGDSAIRPIVVSNIRIRYTINTEQEDNIGSVAKVFQAVNMGNVPCGRRGPCSPDGHWKAAVGSITLDAGTENSYRDVRVTCIAGPCPFTRIDSSGFVHGGRIIAASALNWSDTTTFLLEAEVFRASIDSNVRESYPVIYGRLLNFNLPASEEGASIEADVNGEPMIFPLGPEPYLSWATCAARATEETAKATLYRCELKPGYQF